MTLNDKTGPGRLAALRTKRMDLVERIDILRDQIEIIDAEIADYDSKKSEQFAPYSTLLSGPCEYCRYRQRSLDPCGCFKEVSSTGKFGRFLRWFFGCEAFEEL